jgi:hypothetical protein
MDMEVLHRGAVDLTRELGNDNYALCVNRRELEMLDLSLVSWVCKFSSGRAIAVTL